MKVVELLTELIGVKKFKEMTSDEIRTYLEKTFNAANGPMKIKLLGQGAHAVAVQIGSFAYKFWLVDDAYEKFAEYAIKHQDNPLMPKIYGGIKSMPAFFVKHEAAPARVKYVKMELLQPLQSGSIKIVVIPGFSDTLGLDRFISNSYRWIHNETWKEDFLKWIPNAVPSQMYDGKYALPEGATFDDLSYELKLWATTCRELYDLNHQEADLDLHSENLMARGNQPVILDPVADENSMNLNSMFERFNRNLMRNRIRTKQEAQKD